MRPKKRGCRCVCRCPDLPAKLKKPLPLPTQQLLLDSLRLAFLHMSSGNRCGFGDFMDVTGIKLSRGKSLGIYDKSLTMKDYQPSG